MPEASQTILVVNDNADTSDLMRVLLAKAGYQVLSAFDGNEGVYLASSEKPDLVISDVNMPKLDGIELCRRLRAQPGTRLLPVILISAERMGSENAVAGLRAGADDYLEAPFDPIRMIGKVVRLLERKQAEEELGRSNEQLRALSIRLQVAREEERIRIAREIHDELGGALTGLKMDLSWIGKRLSEQSRGAVQQKLQSALELIDETIAQVRYISTELRPPMLDDLGLAAAIEWQAREFQRRTEIRCKIVSLQEDITLSPEKSTAVFRIFQEILTNVARHSQASSVEVRMEEQDGCLTLKVSDNGKGIEEGKVAESTSIGLLGMKERAMIFGGQVNVVGAGGRGTTVTVRIPLA